MVNFRTWIPNRQSHSAALLDSFLLTIVLVLQWLSPHLEIVIMWFSQFPLISIHVKTEWSISLHSS